MYITSLWIEEKKERDIRHISPEKGRRDKKNKVSHYRVICTYVYIKKELRVLVRVVYVARVYKIKKVKVP